MNRNKTKLYYIWSSMKSRCENENNESFHNYGGRGITLCEEWHDLDTFVEWAINAGYNETLSLDRVDVNGNYEPNNCRWITKHEQAYNRRTNVRITFNGETKFLTEWAHIFGCNKCSVYKEILEREGRIIRGGGAVK